MEYKFESHCVVRGMEGTDGSLYMCEITFKLYKEHFGYTLIRRLKWYNNLDIDILR